MTAKDLLLDNKELASFWRTVAHNRDTARVLALVWAEWLHTNNPTREHVEGARAFEAVMLTISEEEPNLSVMPEIGLNHGIDDPRSEKLTNQDNPT